LGAFISEPLTIDGGLTVGSLSLRFRVFGSTYLFGGVNMIINPVFLVKWALQEKTPPQNEQFAPENWPGLTGAYVRGSI